MEYPNITPRCSSLTYTAFLTISTLLEKLFPSCLGIKILYFSYQYFLHFPWCPQGTPASLYKPLSWPTSLTSWPLQTALVSKLYVRCVVSHSRLWTPLGLTDKSAISMRILFDLPQPKNTAHSSKCRDHKIKCNPTTQETRSKREQNPDVQF